MGHVDPHEKPQEVRPFFLGSQQESSLRTKWVASEVGTILGKRLLRETVTLSVLSGTLGSLDAYCSGSVDVPPQGERIMGGGALRAPCSTT